MAYYTSTQYLICPFNSEGSPLLHPVALLIIKLQCDNIVNYVQQFPFDLKRIIFVELDTI